MLRLHCVIALIAIAAAWLPCSVTLAQGAPPAEPPEELTPEEAYDEAVALFDRGEWQAAADAFDRILNPPRLRSRNKIKKARVYRGICLVILKDEGGAEAEFYQVLLLDSKHQLDPQYTPPEIIRFFNGIRKKYAEELGLGTGENGKNGKRDPRDGRPIEKDPDVNVGADILLTVAPFGIGQIHNDQRTKGFVVMGSEISLLATNVISFLYLQNLEVNGKFPRDQLQTAETVQIVNLASFTGLLVMLVYGLVDALVYKYGASGQETVPETNPKPTTPPSPRPVLSIVPLADPSTPGAQVIIGVEFYF